MSTSPWTWPRSSNADKSAFSSPKTRRSSRTAQCERVAATRAHRAAVGGGGDVRRGVRRRRLLRRVRRAAARSRRVADEYAAYSDRRRGDERAPAMRSAYERPRARREGIPLVRPTQPYERRDVDGGYGDRPGFSDWVVRDTRRTEREFETVDAYWEPPTRRASAAAPPPRSFPAGAEPPRGDDRRPRSSPNPSPPPTTRAMRRPNDLPRSSGTFDAAEDML